MSTSIHSGGAVGEERFRPLLEGTGALFYQGKELAKAVKKELEKVYDPAQVEQRIYQTWVDGGYFHAKAGSKKKPYTIVLPPPNVTGQLHMGHALDSTIQDILIRFKRMEGYEALWIPGTDHAAIATEVKIVESMAKEGLTKEAIGRDAFLKRAWDWTEEYGGTIVEQLKRIGASCDWDRLRFTMDEGCSLAVRTAFARLYKKGLIYRGERMINWCPHCHTTLSDAEVEYEEKEAHLWEIRYPYADGSGEIVVATTRPETILGDTAVAVHPKDSRYHGRLGVKVCVPLTQREVPIVGDEYVDLEFGTGAVKITPAHDPNDFLVAERHQLPLITVLDEDGKLCGEEAGGYAGMTREDAREKVVEDLKAGGFLVSSRNYTHNVGACYRCHTAIEPRLSTQWFVKMKPLAEPARQAVEEGKTHFIPDRFRKTYDHWLENIRDWCISRQIWWGHQIPAFYCDDCQKITVSVEAPSVCAHCGSTNIHQDQDTLDTWFSSALWPFSTLGWPQKTKDYAYFYPTNTLVTAYDIIFFWVTRMIFSGLEYTGETPFETVLIHGLVRDDQGRKMSKSLGNGINPLDMIEKYGADALRFTLATGNSPGNDMRFLEERVVASRNFTNKIWNAARFLLMNLGDEKDVMTLPSALNLEDRWIVSKLNGLIREVTENLNRFEMGLALQKVYDFIWDIYCDWYIELCKPRLQKGGEESLNAQRVLVYVMVEALKLLHPFLPFLTEEIYQALPHDTESIMISSWPDSRNELIFREEERAFEHVIEAIRAIRNQRAQMNIPPGKKARVIIETDEPELYQKSAVFFERLAFASEVLAKKAVDMPGSVTIVTGSARIFIPLDELIDREQEKSRLQKDLAKCEKDCHMLAEKLRNKGFLEKAPEKVVELEREKLRKAEEKRDNLKKSLSDLD